MIECFGLNFLSHLQQVGKCADAILDHSVERQCVHADHIANMLHVFVHCNQTKIESDRSDNGNGGDNGNANYCKCDDFNALDGSVTIVTVFMVDLCV
jgi:hypothetical protein